MDAFLCVSIDCECDKGPGWRVRKPLAFEGIVKGIGERLQPLFRRHGAKPTYLLSPEVMRDQQSVETLAALPGDAELGTHLHGEFIDAAAAVPDSTAEFQCNYDRDTERAKLSTLTDLFRSAFGRAPRSFRAGRFGIGRHSLSLLADLGYRVDSSVTPLKDWAKAGAPEASFRNAGTQPYWPVLDRPACPAGEPGRLLEVPVTILPSRVPILGRWLEPRWLRPTRGSLNGLLATARDELKRTRSSPVVLNCMFHNVEIMPGLSPYAQTEAAADAILGRLAGLLAMAQREGIRCVGLGDIPSLVAASNPGQR